MRTRVLSLGAALALLAACTAGFWDTIPATPAHPITGESPVHTPNVVARQPDSTIPMSYRDMCARLQLRMYEAAIAASGSRPAASALWLDYELLAARHGRWAELASTANSLQARTAIDRRTREQLRSSRVRALEAVGRATSAQRCFTRGLSSVWIPKPPHVYTHQCVNATQ